MLRVSGFLAFSEKVTIIGGGLMGSSIAYHLALRHKKPSQIIVIEQDSTFKRASSPRAVGGIRSQFSVRESVALSGWSFDFLKNVNDHLSVKDNSVDISLIQSAYMFLAGTDSQLATLRRDLSHSPVSYLTKDEVYSKFPWVNPDLIVGGSYGGVKEGWFDTSVLLHAFRRKAKSLGVTFLDQTTVRGLDVEGPSHARRITGVFVSSADGSAPAAPIATDLCVNTAGSWASDVAAMAGIGRPITDPVRTLIPYVHEPLKPAKFRPIDGTACYESVAAENPQLTVGLPIRPRRRCVYVVATNTPPGGSTSMGSIFPLTILPNGIYLRRENPLSFLVGGGPSMNSDDDDVTLEMDVPLNFDAFEEHIWPILADYIPAFESLKLRGGWYGTYEYCALDQSPIIGFHPAMRNFFTCAGFSGHGSQQSPAAGCMSAALIAGEKPEIDISVFGWDRVFNNKPLPESAVV